MLSLYICEAGHTLQDNVPDFWPESLLQIKASQNLVIWEFWKNEGFQLYNPVIRDLINLIVPANA